MDTVWGGRVCALKGRTVAFLVNTDHHISSTKCPIQKDNHDFLGTTCTENVDKYIFYFKSVQFSFIILLKCLQLINY